MGKRGPKSAAALMIPADESAGDMRPDAPYTLTDEEADQWRAMVNSMQPGYFAPTHHAMLSQLCRHIVQSNRVAHLIDIQCRRKTIDTGEYGDLLKLQSQESGAIMRLMRQMRLAHKSLYRADSVKQRPMKTIEAPWHREDQ